MQHEFANRRCFAAMNMQATVGQDWRGRGPHPLSLFLALVLRHTSGNPARLRAVLKGLRRYQEAPFPPPMPEAPITARRGTVSLRYIGGPADAPPVVVVPSLINAAIILDLGPGRSLVRYLADQGHRVYMVDWGPLGQGERRLGFAGQVRMRLLPLIRNLGEPVHLVGYCLGGTLAVGAARHLGDRARSLALIASPWHFDGFHHSARTHALGIWGLARPIADKLGALPVSFLNPLFWSLGEDDVINKFERLAAREADDPAISWFAAVEDWTNSGPPLSIPFARDLFLRGFGADIFGTGRWKVAGVPIRPQDIPCPVFDVVAMRDRIVPPDARIRGLAADRLEVQSGHVGMIVGGAAPKTLWEPLSNWLANR